MIRLHPRFVGFSKPLLFAICAMMASHRQAAAQSDTWNPSGSTIYWSTASNWTGTHTPPISGDSLIFGADNAAGTSNSHIINDDLTSTAFNVAGLTFNSNAPGYFIVGNSFTLTGNITNSSTAGQAIYNAISLSAGAHTFSGSLTLNGNITGSNVNGSTLAAGGGTVTLAGTDSFTTTGGNSSVQVTGGSLLVVSGATTILLGNNDFIGVGAGSAGGLTVASGGTLNVSGGNNGFYLGVFAGGNGGLAVNGTVNIASTTPLYLASFNASAGTVYLNAGGVLSTASGIVGGYGGGSGTSTFYFNGGTLKATGAGGGSISSITAVVAQNSTQSTIDSNSYSTSVASVISGGGSLNIVDSSGTNSGLVTLGASNTYSGGTTLNSGGLLLNNTAAAGTGTLTLAGGALIDNANFTNALNVTGNVIVANLYDNPDGAHSGALSGAGTLTVGAATVGGTTYSPTSSFKYSGTLSGFTGTFVDNTNTNVILQGAAVAGSASAKFQINGGAFYTYLPGNVTTLNAGELSGNSAGSINLNGLTLSEGALNTSSTYAGVLAGLALTKVGSGTLTLSGDSTYSGGTSVSTGTLQLNNASGAGTGSIAVGSSGILALNYPGTQANTITGTGVISILNSTGNNTVLSGNMSGFTGTVNVGSSAGTGGKTVVSGFNSSNPNLTSSTTINVASGGTFFDYGFTVPSTINVSGSGNSEGFGALRLDAGAIFSGPVNLLGTTTVGNYAGGGTYGTISGVISGSGFGLTKVAPNPIILSGANTYTGATLVSAGALLVNGSTASGSTVTVSNSGSILGGGGTVAGSVTVNAGASLSPGSTIAAGATAKLTTGALTLASTSNLLIDLSNATAGTGYDQIITTGAVSLNGSNLTVTVSGSALSIGQKLFILNNGSASAITGTFAGLANNATFSSGSDTFRINYFDTGDSTTGNDISLSVLAVPEPATWAGGVLLFCALGLRLRNRIGHPLHDWHLLASGTSVGQPLHTKSFAEKARHRQASMFI